MFHRVMKKLRQISIHSELHLRAVVEMVTERAIAEPKFSKVYADLCCCMKGDRQRHLEEGLEKTCVEVQQRSLGIFKFIGELFKLKMVSEGIIHDCIVRLLKKSKSLRLKSTSTGHFNPLWSLCVLLCTTGKDLDFERAKPRMDQYFNQMKNPPTGFISCCRMWLI
ncbi:eukaryotic translation initiation factor 4 gamma 1-like isoform X2 [Alosa sapidissima]|uniref:eukaryotic translation initiation factor 4 gamma 1-like isoform X2 n=1 Tax=Alosa sapidissima TaxID=34773 RepID=UPI001C0993EB|nr:eukaryotic translation initiation factor 4 gamma 1-like isoform X2 [Alosa sapidissima]